MLLLALVLGLAGVALALGLVLAWAIDGKVPRLAALVAVVALPSETMVVVEALELLGEQG